MTVLSYDLVLNPTFNILEREGKLQCFFSARECRVRAGNSCYHVKELSMSLQLLALQGLRMVTRVCQRGQRWSAPRCGSWVAACLNLTILVCNVIEIAMFRV